MIDRARESRNPKKVIRVTLMESYGEIGRVPVNLCKFCFIVISPNYIVYFISLSRYDYTHHSMDRNRAYHVLAIIRLSEYNYIDNV